MKFSRKTIVISAFSALLLLGGCSAFRSFFDEDPAVTQQKREKAKKQQEARQRSGEDSGVFPSFLRAKPEKHEPAFSSSLTPEERAVLEQTEAASKRRDPSEEAETIRRENRERSDKLSEGVFGGGLKDWF